MNNQHKNRKKKENDKPVLNIAYILSMYLYLHIETMQDRILSINHHKKQKEKRISCHSVWWHRW